MPRTAKRLAAGLTSAAAIVAAFGLAASPPPAEPVSSDSGATLVIQLGPSETIEDVAEPAAPGATTYALGRWKCDKESSVS